MEEENKGPQNPPQIRRLNYVKQLNAFRSLSGVRHLKTQAVVLYDVLFSIGNRKGFPEWFYATNEYLQESTNILTWRTFTQVRQALVDNGFIRYIPGKTGTPGSYFLVKLYEPVPDAFISDMELANKKYIEMEERIALLTKIYPDSKDDDHKSRMKVTCQKADEMVCNIAEEPSEQKADEMVCKKAEETSEQKAEGFICEMLGGSSAKKQNINKIKKVCIKNNNKHGTDTWFKPHIEFLDQNEVELDALNRASHLRRFEQHTRNGRLSKQEKINFDLLESTYSAYEIDSAIDKAEAHNACSAGYVLKILQTVRR